MHLLKETLELLKLPLSVLSIAVLVN